jgi:hypothetical protein
VADAFGKIVRQRDFEFQGFPAREFGLVGKGKANFGGQVRLILIDRRLYQIMVIFMAQNPHLADFKVFFDSFSVHNRNERNL